MQLRIVSPFLILGQGTNFQDVTPDGFAGLEFGKGEGLGRFVREAELLREAVGVKAPALILSHNHPSGDPTPSPEDVRITDLINKAAQSVGP